MLPQHATRFWDYRCSTWEWLGWLLIQTPVSCKDRQNRSHPSHRTVPQTATNPASQTKKRGSVSVYVTGLAETFVLSSSHKHRLYTHKLVSIPILIETEPEDFHRGPQVPNTPSSRPFPLSNRFLNKLGICCCWL